MRRFVVVMAGLALAACLPAHGEEPGRLHGAWLQTAPAWSVTPDNPWTVMIFNADGTFCGGSKKDNRYSEGLYRFDGALQTTISNSSGRLSERTVAFRGQAEAVWDDPQIHEPVVMVRTDMFGGCAAMKAHQGR